MLTKYYLQRDLAKFKEHWCDTYSKASIVMKLKMLRELQTNYPLFMRDLIEFF